jgi:Kef-type K+ transport system membrane component KefB
VAAGTIAAPPSDAFAMLMVQLVVIVITAQVVARAARALWQPAVIGELAAGIVLGPSVLGLVSPAVFSALFPPASIAPLALVGQIGVVLYIFVVGTRLVGSDVAQNARVAIAPSVIRASS